MRKKIAAFGEVMMRLQVPGYELLSQANTLNYSFSGTGVNVVAALSHLGHEGLLISTLPENSVGDAAVSYIQKLGIQTSLVSRGGKYVGMYFLENGFGARASRVTYSNRLESSFNTASEEIYQFEEIAKEIDIVHFCGITLAMNDTVRHHMKSLARAVKENGGTVVFDCNYRPSLWGEDGYEQAKPHYEEMLGLADIVMMNEKDAMFVLGIKTEETEREAQLVDLIPKVAETYHIATIAGTHRSINSDNTHSLRGFISLADGSGLSRGNRLAAASLVRVIAQADADPTWGTPLINSLARGGEGTLIRRFTTGVATKRVRAKTGYLDGVSAMAGRVVSRRGVHYGFALLMNTTDITGARAVQDDVVTLLAAGAEDGP